MKSAIFFCLSIAAAAVPAASWADDPNDPDMRTAAARARDRELTRQLNLAELAKVKKRDARMFADHNQRNAAISRDHDYALADYERSRSQYEWEMAAWRRAVAACREGDYYACRN
ncbi:MAG: hypothetical protein AB7U35_13720 [Sphingobium sp.]